MRIRRSSVAGGLYVLWTVGCGVLSLYGSVLIIRILQSWMSWPRGPGALAAWFIATAVLMLPLEALGIWILGVTVTRDRTGRLVVVTRGAHSAERT